MGSTSTQESIMKLAPAILVASALASGPVCAAVEQNPAGTKLPAEMTQGGVHYLTGGIGAGEVQAFRKAQHEYPLALEFADKATPHNEFTADVKVVIRDAKGKTVLDAVSSGPFLFAKLAAGSYTIEATQNGRTLQRHATVAKGQSKHLGFLWAANRVPVRSK
jgi:hypothetical protein